MKNKEQILPYVFDLILARNDRFKGFHAGETCYIFGNGASLKNMELKAFSDHISIGLNFLCLHKDFRLLNSPYYVAVESFFLYPFIKNPYTQRYQRNLLGGLFKKAIAQYPDISVFTSITNMFGFGIKKPFYLYHFGKRQASRDICDISGAFSFMAGALCAGIGLAINMGFKKAILVGCDYTFSPTKNGHFYAYGPPMRATCYDNTYAKLFQEAAGCIDLEVITDSGVSQHLPCRDYENFTGKKIKYRENNEIVAPEYLELLNQAKEVKQYTMPIYPDVVRS